jgi:hypothetical protein
MVPFGVKQHLEFFFKHQGGTRKTNYANDQPAGQAQVEVDVPEEYFHGKNS